MFPRLRVASPLRPLRRSRQRRAPPVMMAAEVRWVQWGIHLVGPPSSYAVRSQARSRGVRRAA